MCNSGAGLVLPMVPFSPSIQQPKQVYNWEANDVGVLYIEWTIYFCFYRCCLLNHLHGKAAEPCLAKS